VAIDTACRLQDKYVRHVNFIIVRALFEGGVNFSSARARSAGSIRGWEEIKEIWYVPHSFG